MQLTEKHREEIAARIVKTMSQALRSGDLILKDLRPAARYILDHLDEPKSQEEMIELLKEIYVKWPVFSHILTVEKGLIVEEEDRRKAKELEKLIKEKKLNQSISGIAR